MIKSLSRTSDKIYTEKARVALEEIALFKWKNGYRCSNCANQSYIKGKVPYSRRCSKCKKDESPTAGTLFHKLRIRLEHALSIVKLCLNKERRLNAVEMRAHVKQETGEEIDLNALAVLRTKIYDSIPRERPVFTDETNLIIIDHFQTLFALFVGTTKNGKHHYCVTIKNFRSVDSFVNEYVAVDSSICICLINKKGKIIRRNSGKRPALDFSEEIVRKHVSSVMSFCFETAKGSFAYQQKCIDLYVYLCNGGNYDDFMRTASNTDR